MSERATEGTHIQCALDSKERPLHCHHEKTIVIDDRVAFVGGIDLTAEDGDRFDSSDHPARAAVGWHDACARIEGPAVGDVAAHFRMRWHEVTGEPLAAAPPASPAAASQLQIVRTIPEKVYAAEPRGDFRILESYTARAAVGAAVHLPREPVSLVTRDRRSARDKLADPPMTDFRILARPAGEAEQR